MQPFLAALHHRPLLADGALGSYLFALTGRVSEQNHLYEAFNLARPELVRQLHLEYLQAGAQCLTSNSFAANATYPSAAPIAEINATAVRLAREAIDQYRQQDQCSAPLFVLGSLGPPLPATPSPRTASDLYRAQIETLVESGVDALLLETFTCLEQVVALLELLQDLDNPAPVIVQMALHQRDGTWKQSPQAYVQTAAALGAHVVGINCCALAEARAFLDAVQECASVRDGQVQLAVMPNGRRVPARGPSLPDGRQPRVHGALCPRNGAQGRAPHRRRLRGPSSPRPRDAQLPPQPCDRGEYRPLGKDVGPAANRRSRQAPQWPVLAQARRGPISQSVSSYCPRVAPAG